MGKHLGHVLHLVQDGGGLDAVQESLGIGPQPGDDIRVFQQVIVSLGEQLPQHPGLARPARAGQDQRGKGFQRPGDLLFEFPMDIAHC